MIKTVGVEEVAEALGISTRHVWRMNKAKLIPAPLHIGRKRRWVESVLNEWVLEGCPSVIEIARLKCEKGLAAIKEEESR